MASRWDYEGNNSISYLITKPLFSIIFPNLKKSTFLFSSTWRHFRTSSSFHWPQNGAGRIVDILHAYSNQCCANFSTGPFTMTDEHRWTPGLLKRFCFIPWASSLLNFLSVITSLQSSGVVLYVQVGLMDMVDNSGSHWSISQNPFLSRDVRDWSWEVWGGAWQLFLLLDPMKLPSTES